MGAIGAKVQRRQQVEWHNRRIAGIRTTPPLVGDASGRMYLSMVCHRDTLACLAVKSVAPRVGVGVTLIDDGSLNRDDRAVLAHHLQQARILAVGEIDTTGFPRGGTWERLLTVLDLASDHYVVQVDPDVVAQGPLTEVTAAVAANTGVTLPGEPTSRLMGATQAAGSVRAASGGHVQLAAERLLTALRYGRGCPGFAGFSVGNGGRSRVAVFSQFIEARLGRLWHKWGSEQVASNVVVANTADPVLLPWDRYPASGGKTSVAQAALVHLLGPHRYEGGVFTASRRRAIGRLGCAPQ